MGVIFTNSHLLSGRYSKAPAYKGRGMSLLSSGWVINELPKWIVFVSRLLFVALLSLLLFSGDMVPA